MIAERLGTTPWQLLATHTAPQIEELRVYHNLQYWQQRLERKRVKSAKEKRALLRKILGG